MDAKVAAINAGTNVRHEGATNGSGEYYLTNLPPGGHRIEIEKTGFRKLIKSEVVLHFQDALDIDFGMTLGSGSESITNRPLPAIITKRFGCVPSVMDHDVIRRESSRASS